jgi:DNA polymerase III alpha subunit (gram-positive type)
MTKPIVFFDLETSGLSPNQNEIIQIGAVACELRGEGGVEFLDTFERLLHFDIERADEKALEINGFNADRWNAEAVEQDAGMREFCDWLEPYMAIDKLSQRGKFYRTARLGGHNAAKFDGPFLSATAKRLGLFLPADFLILDTLQLALWLWPFPGDDTPEDYKLPTVYQFLTGDPLVDAHDAVADVKATAIIADLMLAQLKEGGSHVAEPFAI